MAGCPQSEERPMPTIRRVPDELWEKIEPILQEHDPKEYRAPARGPACRSGRGELPASYRLPVEPDAQGVP